MAVFTAEIGYLQVIWWRCLHEYRMKDKLFRQHLTKLYLKKFWSLKCMWCGGEVKDCEELRVIRGRWHGQKRGQFWLSVDVQMTIATKNDAVEVCDVVRSSGEELWHDDDVQTMLGDDITKWEDIDVKRNEIKQVSNPRGPLEKDSHTMNACAVRKF